MTDANHVLPDGVAMKLLRACALTTVVITGLP